MQCTLTSKYNIGDKIYLIIPIRNEWIISSLTISKKPVQYQIEQVNFQISAKTVKVLYRIYSNSPLELESDLFTTIQEAEQECIKRNKILKDTRIIKKDLRSNYVYKNNNQS